MKKYRINITLLLTFLLIGLFAFTSGSCSQKTYGSRNNISYNRNDRIKVYNSKSRSSFDHDKSVRKKYVIKKKKRK